MLLCLCLISLISFLTQVSLGQKIVALDSDQFRELVLALSGPVCPTDVMVDQQWIAENCPVSNLVSVSNSSITISTPFLYKNNVKKSCSSTPPRYSGYVQGVYDQLYLSGFIDIKKELFRIISFHSCITALSGRVWTSRYYFTRSDPDSTSFVFESTNVIPCNFRLPLTKIENWLSFQALNVFKTLDLSDPNASIVQNGMQEQAYFFTDYQQTGTLPEPPLVTCNNFTTGSNRFVYHKKDYVTFFGYSGGKVSLYTYRNPGIRLKTVSDGQVVTIRPDISIESVNLFGRDIMSWPADTIPVGFVYHSNLTTTSDFVSAGFRSYNVLDGCDQVNSNEAFGATIPFAYVLDVPEGSHPECNLANCTTFNCGFTKEEDGVFVFRNRFRMATDQGILGRDIYHMHSRFSSLNGSSTPVVVMGPSIMTFLGDTSTTGPYLLSDHSGTIDSLFGVVGALAPQPVREQILAIQDTFDTYYNLVSDAWDTFQKIYEISSLVLSVFSKLPFT